MVQCYEVWFLNFNYFADETFSSLEQAEEYGLSKGFEFAVYHNDGRNRDLKTVWAGVNLSRHKSAN